MTHTFAAIRRHEWPRKSREAPQALRRQARVAGAADRGAGGAAEAQAATGRSHLRAWKLGACRDVRQASDRASHRHSGFGRRAKHRLALSPAPVDRRTSSSSRSRKPAAAPTSSSPPSWRRPPARSRSQSSTIPTSPLASASEIVLPIEAQAELSVAATKTFVASLAVLLRLVAAWKDDAAICSAASTGFRTVSAAASGVDWSAAVPALSAGEQPDDDRTRADACDCARSLAQAERDLWHSRRGVQRCGIPARPAVADRARPIRC